MGVLHKDMHHRAGAITLTLRAKIANLWEEGGGIGPLHIAQCRAFTHSTYYIGVLQLSHDSHLTLE